MRIVNRQANPMNRTDTLTSRPRAPRPARLWVAASHGTRRAAPIQIAPAGAPELPMVVSFEGLTPDEQRAALAAFPGGRRFVLQG